MLTVVSVGYPLAPAGPDAVGGSEQVLASLDGALVRAGHRSLVIAPAGSRIAGRLIATPRVPAAIDATARRHAHHATREALRTVLRNERVDLVHMHGLDFAEYLPPPGPPVLVTLHLPLDWYPSGALRPGRPRTSLHAVSAAQHATAPRGLDLLPPIPNGVAVDEFGAVRLTRRNFALMLGRVCPEKGVHLALDAARAAGISLLIGGAVFPYPAHQDYFAAEIRPLLDAQRRYLGPLGFARKRRLLAAARCLLVPSLVAETGSLVAMEALACGTPVIAFPNGALADVVEDGRTGFLVRDTPGMAAAIGRVAEIEAETCRHAARTRFSLAAMTGAYLALYARLVAQVAPVP